ADGDAGRVAAEGRDVALDPFERGDQVAKGVVRGAVVFGAEERAEIKEAEDSEAVGNGHADDALAGELGAVVDGLEGVAGDIASAVDPDEDRERAFALGRPDVEVKAVLAVVDGRLACSWLVLPLHGGGGE